MTPRNRIPTPTRLRRWTPALLAAAIVALATLAATVARPEAPPPFTATAADEVYASSGTVEIVTGHYFAVGPSEVTLLVVILQAPSLRLAVLATPEQVAAVEGLRGKPATFTYTENNGRKGKLLAVTPLGD